MITVNESTRSQTSTANAILSKASKNRVKNATEVLERYIEQFADVVQTNASGTPIPGCYGSSNVSLLSTKHKSISPARKRRRKAAKSAEKEESMSNDLVQWVNESYTKDLQRKIVPFGQRSNSSVDTDTLSETEENGESIGDEVSTITESDVQLSTLPSPGNSDLDSNVDSLNTEILVRSYHRHHNSQPSQGKVKTHPSWVEELVIPKNYPSWIDDIDQTQTEQDALSDQQNQRNRLSRSLSPSFFQEHPPRSRGAPSHLSTSLQDQPTKISGTHRNKSKAWEVESTDTEVLISESIYGRHPVNMGGVLHSSLYHDKQIQHLHEHSVKKFAKDFERSLAKEMSFSGTRVEEGKNNDEKSGTQRMIKPRKTAEIPVSGSAVKMTEYPEEAPRPSQEDRRLENTNKTNFQIQRNWPNKKVLSSTATRPSSLDVPKKHGKKSMSEIRKNSTDSTNTDKLMRQSPTGIRMGKKVASPRNIRNSSNKDSKNNSSNKDCRNVSSKRSGGISTQGRTPILMRTSNTPNSTRGVRTSKLPHSAYDFSSPNAASHSASEELQRIIDEADINFDEATRQREDRYLSGKVTKKDLMVRHRNNNDRNLNKVRANTPKGSQFKTSKPNEQHDNYLLRANPRTLSPRRLDPTDKRLPWDGNFASDDHVNNVYERNTPGTGAPRWNSDPTRFYPRSRARTKLAPDMNAGRLWKSLPGHEKYNKQPLLRSSNVARRRTSGADYANQKKISNDKYLDKRKISGADYVNQSNNSNANYANKLRISGADYTNQRNISNAYHVNERETSYDDMDSVDTEALVIKPPMPIFDASPSLSTESAESSVGSEESGDTLIENLAMRTSFLATDNDIQSSSGTSYLELATSPQQAQEVSQDWKEELPPNARLNDYAKVTKPGIITSFLQDCMRSSQGSRSDKSNNGEFPKSSFNEEQSVISEDTSSERPVETLKKMLFTVQSLTRSSEDISDQDGNDHSPQTQSESLTEEMLSDILSTASCNEGQDSLSRAYYHLARLKRLVSASREVAAWK